MTASGDSTPMKTCTKCASQKTIFDFNAMAASKDGRAFQCKACSSEQNAAWRKANHERLKISKALAHAENKEKNNRISQAWYAANREYAKAKNAAYREENRENSKQRSVQWRLQNLQRSRDGVRAWRKSNPDTVRAINKAFLAANPGAKRAYENNRRKNAAGKLSRDLAPRLYALQRGYCPCCKLPLGDDYHLDHIQPLALGGLNVDSNMQLLRKVCNLRKNAKHPVDYMQSKGFLL